MKTDLFDYALPPELIAQTPLPREKSRLLVLHRDTRRIEHRAFPNLVNYLAPGDTLVLNETRVSARRLVGIREGGQTAEVLLLRPTGARCWEALVKPGKSLRPGKGVLLQGPGEQQVTAEIVATTDEGGRILEFVSEAVRDALSTWGTPPLPPYIQTPLPRSEEERYQTVYSRQGNSAAAPTAGLHFTPGLLENLTQKGVRFARLNLDVGIGTFRPVRSETIAEHQMHSETLTLSAEAAESINTTPGKVVAVGTTSVRALESVAAFTQDSLSPNGKPQKVAPFTGATTLFITPGYRFRVVEALVTNFHLPKSTLLMMISAFADRDLIFEAYHEAIREKYRFFSFGDAMLIL